MAKKTVTSSPYTVHPSVTHGQQILENLPEKTGKSLEQWLAIVEKSGLDEGKAIQNWLKGEHKMGSITARLISERAVGKELENTDSSAYLEIAPQYINAQYAGAKALLRPICDTLISMGRSLGDDVKVCPCKTMVPLYRDHVFATIKPTTRTRADLGLALGTCQQKLIARLEDTGGAARGDRITHRFRLSSVDEIDAQVEKWLKIAYDLDG